MAVVAVQKHALEYVAHDYLLHVQVVVVADPPHHHVLRSKICEMQTVVLSGWEEMVCADVCTFGSTILVAK